MTPKKFWLSIAGLLAAFVTVECPAQEIQLNSSDPNEAGDGFFNIPTPTLGGKQFWTDHCFRNGWKIQQNALTKHWRLLDDNAVRRAWGSRGACQQVLDQKQPTWQSDRPLVIVLLHGLMRSSTSMNSMAKALERGLNCDTVAFEYASTRLPIAQHAEALRDCVQGIPADRRIAFVGHSMGNIVVRHAIGDWQRQAGTSPLSRIHGFVMLGPPNQGASIARQLSKTGLFKLITGESGMQLGPEWDRFESRLAIPPFPFGIIAGHFEGPAQNPLVDGASDLVVSVEETKLEGATDFMEVPRLHSFMMDDPEIQQATIQFFKHGKFAATGVLP